MNNKYVNGIIAVIFSCFFLCSCLPESKVKAPEPQTMTHARIMGHPFYIPDAYLSAPYTSIGNESALIQAWYPGNLPVPGDPNKLWKQGEWHKNVRILITYVPKPSIERVLEARLETRHATKVVGEEYGLIHQTQPEGQVADHDDLWIERESGKLKSFISCSEDFVANVPQCKHMMNIESFSLKIHYNKNLLPHWNLIRDNVVSLFDSFSSAETAQAYFEKLTTIKEKEEKP